MERDDNAPAECRPCYVTIHTFGPDGEPRSAPADRTTQERWEVIRKLILTKEAEAEARARQPPPKPAGKEMIVFYPEPSFSDLKGWKRHLEWLRTEPVDIQSREMAIELAEYHIMVLETCPSPEQPAEAD